jgi:hypothetical protein
MRFSPPAALWPNTAGKDQTGGRMLSGQPAPKLTRHEHLRLNMRAAAASREIAIGPRSEGPDVAAAQPI